MLTPKTVERAVTKARNLGAIIRLNEEGKLTFSAGTAPEEKAAEVKKWLTSDPTVKDAVKLFLVEETRLLAGVGKNVERLDPETQLIARLVKLGIPKSLVAPAVKRDSPLCAMVLTQLEKRRPENVIGAFRNLVGTVKPDPVKEEPMQEAEEDDSLDTGEPNILFEDPVMGQGYVQLPWMMVSDPFVSAGAVRTYACLLHYGWKKGSCFPKQESVAESLGVKKLQVIQYLKELADVGYITIKRRGQGKSNIYTINRLREKNASKDVDF